MPVTRDYYEVLGVPRDASAADIKKAFRAKAREVHPDTSDHDNAEELFKELNEAYEVLSDPEKRANYDRFGTAAPGGFGGGPDAGYGWDSPFGASGMGDIFSAFFGGTTSAGVGAPRTEGRDMTAQVVVTLEEAASGGAKEVKYTRSATCPTCGGTGTAEGGHVVTCPECNGTGRKVWQRNTFFGRFESVHPCERCGGTGSIIDKPCPTCAGDGRTPATERVTVEIPAGVQDGQRVRVAGKGEAGFRGARSGDLLVTVRIKAHDFLHREGDDLHARAAIPMAVAALGGDLNVPGLFGPVPVHVPSGTQNGDIIVAKGAGMPNARGSNGDLVVHANIVVPKRLKKEQRRLLEQFAESMGDQHSHSPLDRVRDWLGL